MAFLELFNGLHPEQQLPLEGERMVLGRDSDCDIVLEGGTVSRRHAQIVVSAVTIISKTSTAAMAPMSMTA
jgi:hypothetical protein